MKKTISTLFLALLLLLSFSAAAPAADLSFTYTITANGRNELSVAPGEKIEFALIISENSDSDYKLYAMQDYISFDSSRLTLDEESISAYNGFSANLKGSQILLTYIDMSSKGVELNGALTALTFTATAAAQGTVKVSSDKAMFNQANAQPYPLSLQDVSIIVGSAAAGEQGGGTEGEPPADAGDSATPGGGTTPGGATPGGATPSGGARFSDVPTSHWSYASIEYLAQLGVVNGKSGGLFGPNDTVTRAEFVTMLARLSGEQLPVYNNSFSDVTGSAYYAGSVAWAVSVGVTKGAAENSFLPHQRIMRQEIATMIYRYTQYKQHTLAARHSAISFGDQANINSYALEPVRVMQQAGVLSGYSDGSFRPLGYATRAEAAKMLALVSESAGSPDDSELTSASIQDE